MTHIVGSYWSRSRTATRRIRAIQTKPGPFARLWRRVRIAHLRWSIAADVDWEDIYRMNGIDDPVLRRRLSEARVRLAILENGR